MVNLILIYLEIMEPMVKTGIEEEIAEVNGVLIVGGMQRQVVMVEGDRVVGAEADYTFFKVRIL